MGNTLINKTNNCTPFAYNNYVHIHKMIVELNKCNSSHMNTHETEQKHRGGSNLWSVEGMGVGRMFPLGDQPPSRTEFIAKIAVKIYFNFTRPVIPNDSFFYSALG